MSTPSAGPERAGPGRPRRPEQAPGVSEPQGIGRRTFLLRTAEVGLGVAAWGWWAPTCSSRPARPWDESAFPPVGRSRVAVLRAPSYDRDLEAIVDERPARGGRRRAGQVACC